VRSYSPGAKLVGTSAARHSAAVAAALGERGRGQRPRLQVAPPRGKWHSRPGRRWCESAWRQIGDDRAHFDGVRAQCAEPVRRTAAAVCLTRIADAMHDAGAAYYRRLVRAASGGPRRAVAMRLPRRSGTEDLIGDDAGRPDIRCFLLMVSDCRLPRLADEAISGCALESSQCDSS
jgi:hypothetical protein